MDTRTQSTMARQTDGLWGYSRITVIFIVIANSLPFLGLLIFKWGVTELLMVYWLETGVATLIGIMKTIPAKLISIPLPDPRSKPLLKARRGTVSVGNRLITCYGRNVPLVVGRSIIFLLWIVLGLALFILASPLHYMTYGTVESVVIVASLLALTHVLTARSYFAEKRYNQVSALTAGGFSLQLVLGVFGLIAVLFTWHWSPYGPILNIWPEALSYVIIVGKVGGELFLRCRNPDRFKRLDEDTDPFDFETSATDVLLLREPGIKVAELPRVERPDTWPRAIVYPSRRSIVRASPLLGTRESRDATPHIFFAFTILFVVADVQVILPLATLSLAIVFAVAPVLLYTLPRHATLKYECYDNQLICHDYWLDEPVWDLSYDDIEAVSVERGIAARVGGYATVVLKTTDGEPAQLRFLRDYEDVVEYLEHSVRDDVR